MKSKTFLILVIVLVVLGAVSYFVQNREKPAKQTSLMGEKLFKNLPLQNIDAIRISSRENGEVKTVRLLKEDSGWVVTDRFGYPADFKSISDLVEKLSESKIGWSFEGSPDSIERLSLNPPDQEGAKGESAGLRIKLLKDGDAPAVDVIVGKQRESGSGAGGQYLKSVGQNTVYLVDKSFRFIEKNPADWIKTELLNIDSADVQSVVCLSSDGESIIYEASRPEKGRPPELKSAEEGKKLKTRSVNSLFDVLSSLTIQDAAGPSENISGEKTGFKDSPYLEYRLFDGTIYRLRPGKKAEGDEEGYYLFVNVDYQIPEKNDESSGNPAAAGSKVSEDETAAPEKKPGENADPTETSEASETEDEISPKKLAYEAKTMNDRLSAWVYVVSEWERKNMITDTAEFYEEVKTETGDNGGKAE